MRESIFVGELAFFVDSGLAGYAYWRNDQVWDFVGSRGGDGESKARGDVRGK